MYIDFNLFCSICKQNTEMDDGTGHGSVPISQQALADRVKGLHRRLRHQLKETGDAEDVWDKHCQDEKSLKVF